MYAFASMTWGFTFSSISLCCSFSLESELWFTHIPLTLILQHPVSLPSLPAEQKPQSLCLICLQQSKMPLNYWLHCAKLKYHCDLIMAYCPIRKKTPCSFCLFKLKSPLSAITSDNQTILTVSQMKEWEILRSWRTVRRRQETCFKVIINCGVLANLTCILISL